MGVRAAPEFEAWLAGMGMKDEAERILPRPEDGRLMQLVEGVRG